MNSLKKYTLQSSVLHKGQYTAKKITKIHLHLQILSKCGSEIQRCLSLERQVWQGNGGGVKVSQPSTPENVNRSLCDYTNTSLSKERRD